MRVGGPDVASLHEDKVLSKIAIGFSQNDLIARKICNVIPTDKQSDKYRIYDRESLRPQPDERAPRARSRSVGWGYSTDTFYSNEHSLHTLISIEELRNADSDLNLMADATRIIKAKLELNLEISVAARIEATGSYPAGHQKVPTVKWDQATAIPVSDMEDVHEAVFDSIGVYPNTAIMSKKMYRKLKRNPALLAYFDNVSGGLLSAEQLNELLGVDTVLLSDAIKNTALRGQDDVMASVWSDSQIEFHYVNPNLAAKDRPAGLGLFQWTAPHKSNKSISVYKWWEQAIKSYVVEAAWHWDHKVLTADGNGDFLTAGIVSGCWT